MKTQAIQDAIDFYMANRKELEPIAKSVFGDDHPQIVIAKANIWLQRKKRDQKKAIADIFELRTLFYMLKWSHHKFKNMNLYFQSNRHLDKIANFLEEI